MENIEKVVIGLALFAVTSVVAYLFKMRQLYVAVPKLFRNSTISHNGSLCELIVYNKGNQVEESIHVSLDPELKCELLASSSSDVTLQGTTIIIERLHKGSDASAILLIDNGVLDATKIIAASSKGTSGKVLKKVDDLPPNFAGAFLTLVLLVGIVPAMIYGTKAYEKLQLDYMQHRLEATYKLGWSNLTSYYNSDLRKSYSDQEFPIRFIGRKENGSKKAMLTFEVYNKTALPLEVSANKVKSQPGDISGYANLDLPPMSKNTFDVAEPVSDNSSNAAELRFTLKSGEDYLFGALYTHISD